MICASLRVIVSGKKSVWMTNTSRVSKGFLLGPILFYYFVHDLHDEILSARFWMIPFRMTLAGWRNGLIGMSQSSTK